MQIGAMNHPREDVLQEIQWMAEMGLEFLDLTFEPPAAASWCAEPRKIRSALERHGMGVVGHTAFYIPLGSPFEEVRQMLRCNAAAGIADRQCRHAVALRRGAES